MLTSADADVGLSDTEIQSWVDDPLNAYILRYFVDGFYTGIFGMSMWLLLAGDLKISKARIHTGCIITVLYMSSTVYAIATWTECRRAYVFMTSFRGRYDQMNSPVWWNTMAITVLAMNFIIADYTLIWRCWVVWAHNWKVIILPIFFVIGEIVCGIHVVAHRSTVSLNRRNETDLALVTMVITLVTNILCTALIVARIIYILEGIAELWVASGLIMVFSRLWWNRPHCIPSLSLSL
ncbi:hypothetical protein IW261DRAFT_1467867 [Armillaria novae-zelandiae]|uniref:Uncharacterized protein n=1 Tax=Armillaria novae-zelandiae TaxID=153914 RepID=A0AA39UKE0_9AGAR|nr:hypothetical protein IW261DRAFT_1467867 [Armillaria novae-zelandiae]